MTIFKAYDIRGVVPDQLDAEAAHRIGRATARYLGAGVVVVGRDARRSSPELHAALVRGVCDEGVDVVDLGLVSSPMLYYAVDALAAAGGIMITASHNPAEYNGMKLCREHAIPIGEASGLREIERIVGEVADAPPADQRGSAKPEDVTEGYVEHALGVGTGRPRLKVAVDCGNGMASAGLVPLLERLDLEVERLYFEPDGTFPNHEADPLKLENLRDVCDAVRRVGADFGVAFDGDADRSVFVDETGEPIPSDLMTGLLARRVLAQQPGATVLYDLRSSRVTAEEIEASGGRAEMCRVGHSYVKARMRELGAVFAGELSGHFYFRFSPTLVADDGVAAFVALLDVLAAEQRPLSELMAPLRRYAASGEINRRVADIRGLLAAIEAEHADADVSHLDGLLVRYPDWWFNLRPSNTEPVLRLNLEAGSEPEMAARRDDLLARIEAGV
ncbi:MAG: phosphomannomutase/phosphoglucomutase [Myxococcota bacterium]|nr:phosphomannomutase/phosphoglucomutase [Myxococcota bacterium]MDP7073426.1 phosphomannomutase/phosphoglucomutase [Myxococcota bacterium]MDP7300061.1 phosphomannomutase/phosphoglucomutase [Myxococcota bacterium]MDP7433777.1 phosphomannomutase/phosphoglucomutase [Myxococcota bacterium]MDP7571916.1 phosphomannomutase/phosphoglucomutase [Myxococcota bacterium]